jgi:endonuclease-8
VFPASGGDFFVRLPAALRIDADGAKGFHGNARCLRHDTPMPEGDTIHKLARFLDAELGGRAVAETTLHPALGASRGPARVDAVRCKGKHLYIAYDGGVTLRSHLGLYGAWHRYRPGETWRKPRRQASVVLVTDDWLFVCFNAREAEWLDGGGFRHRDGLDRLGSDLIAEPLAPAALLARGRSLLAPQTPLADVLLDQRIAAGIGNVYKSEVLFLAGCAPARALADTDDATLTALYRLASDLLRANLGGGPRATRRNDDGHGHLWVYGRGGLPCLRCGAEVRRGLIGQRPRSTYWCARCQAD